jgi:glycosyltransferase involved in cell wall biosynthesis
MPQTTIVLPVYNGLRRSSDYLPQAIESILVQTVRDFELIIVDDGSTEDYTDIMKHFALDGRLRWVRKVNGGQSSARNYGARLGRGEWLAFIDQDDRWYPHRLEKTLERIHEVRQIENGYILVYSDLDRIDATGQRIHKELLQTIKAGVHPKKKLEDVLGHDAFVLPGTMLMSRENFLTIGGFNETLSGYEDDELALRFYQHGKLSFIRQSLIEWRCYPESYSYSKRMDRSRKIYYQILVNNYPNSELQGKYWVRDHIAPRFYSHWGWAQKQAIQTCNREQYQYASSALRELRSDLRMGLRLRATILSETPWLVARLSHRYPVLGRLARKLLKNR